MKPIPSVLFAVLALSTGCALTDYYPYTGPQKTWPTGDAAFAKRVRNVDFIQGLPAKPYTVLGKFSIIDEVQDIDTQLAWFAKRYQADAVIIGEIDTYAAGSVSVGGGSTAIGSANTTVNIVGNTAYANTSGTVSTFKQPTYNIPVHQRNISGYLIKYLTPTNSP